VGINGEDGITASHAVNGGNFVHNPGNTPHAPPFSASYSATLR